MSVYIITSLELLCAKKLVASLSFDDYVSCVYYFPALCATYDFDIQTTSYYKDIQDIYTLVNECMDIFTCGKRQCIVYPMHYFKENYTDDIQQFIHTIYCIADNILKVKSATVSNDDFSVPLPEALNFINTLPPISAQHCFLQGICMSNKWKAWGYLLKKHKQTLTVHALNNNFNDVWSDDPLLVISNIISLRIKYTYH